MDFQNDTLIELQITLLTDNFQCSVLRYLTIILRFMALHVSVQSISVLLYDWTKLTICLDTEYFLYSIHFVYGIAGVEPN